MAVLGREERKNSINNFTHAQTHKVWRAISKYFRTLKWNQISLSCTLNELKWRCYQFSLNLIFFNSAELSSAKKSCSSEKLTRNGCRLLVYLTWKGRKKSVDQTRAVWWTRGSFVRRSLHLGAKCHQLTWKIRSCNWICRRIFMNTSAPNLQQTNSLFWKVEMSMLTGWNLFVVGASNLHRWITI